MTASTPDLWVDLLNYRTVLDKDQANANGLLMWGNGEMFEWKDFMSDMDTNGADLCFRLHGAESFGDVWQF